MIELKEKIEAFIITNGRSTFSFCLKSFLEQQNVKIKHYIHKDMSWIDANRKILDVCSTPYFLRIDDDMLMHPRCIEFMSQSIDGQKDNIAMRQWMLWEPYTSKSRKGIKIYNTSIAREIGFRINHLGKIDKPFFQDLKKTRYIVKVDPDVVAIHACSDHAEHIKYAVMRGEDKGKNFEKKRKELKNTISSFNKSIEYQYNMATDYVEKYNDNNNTNFHRFLRIQNILK